jgi:uncharacterized membrane protein
VSTASPAPPAPARRPEPDGWLSDYQVDQFVGRLLQVGVLVAATVVLIGGVAILVHYGGTTPDFRVFRAEASPLRSVGGIVRGVLALDSRAIAQLGLLLLIATPVARVALTLVAFVLQRDRLYVAITALVLALLLYGLFWGEG